jgi:hypothetical protein
MFALRESLAGLSVVLGVKKDAAEGVPAASFFLIPFVMVLRG